MGSEDLIRELLSVDPARRLAALTSIAEMARDHKAMAHERVLPLVEAARRDANTGVRDAAEIAFTDIEVFLLDPPRPVEEDISNNDETIDIPSMNVSAAIRRNLRRASGFVPSRGPFRRDEWRVGWYFNPPPYAGTRLLLTTAALHVISEGDAWRVEWSAIEGADEESEGLQVETTEGKRFVPVAGRHGEQGEGRDVFLMMTVLSILKPR